MLNMKLWSPRGLQRCTPAVIFYMEMPASGAPVLGNAGTTPAHDGRAGLGPHAHKRSRGAGDYNISVNCVPTYYMCGYHQSGKPAGRSAGVRAVGYPLEP